jgi:hypothetical protein
MELTTARRQNASAQLQAVDLKARGSAPLLLHFKEANCDDYLGHRACQLQLLVLRQREYHHACSVRFAAWNSHFAGISKRLSRMITCPPPEIRMPRADEPTRLR